MVKHSHSVVPPGLRRLALEHTGISPPTVGGGQPATGCFPGLHFPPPPPTLGNVAINIQAVLSLLRGLTILSVNTFTATNSQRKKAEGGNISILTNFCSRKQNWPPELAYNYFLPLHAQKETKSPDTKEDKGSRVLRSGEKEA